jgi:hypothetical protein
MNDSTIRIDVELSGKATFTSFGRPVESQVVATDLSAHGACLVSGVSPEVGDLVQFHLQQEKPKISFEAEGEVTRLDQLSGDKHGIAIEFQTISDLEN